MANSKDIVIPDDAWTSVGSGHVTPAFFYEGPITINGVEMHLWAYPVVERETKDGGIVHEGAPGWEEVFEGIMKIDPVDERFQTVTIDGQACVFVMMPYLTPFLL
jgi:hypothetical protein